MSCEPPLVLRDAGAAELPALTALAFAAKASWGYDAEFMAACRAELTLTSAKVQDTILRVAEAEGERCGFYQLIPRREIGEVFMMFVAPGRMRHGIGRRLWQDLERAARRAGIRRLEVDSDPFAEGYYRAMGMVRTGDAPSGSIPGRRLPHLSKRL